jgi:hypothetical protein
MVTFAFIWVALAIFVMDAVYTNAGRVGHKAKLVRKRSRSSFFYSQFLRLK